MSVKTKFFHFLLPLIIFLGVLAVFLLAKRLYYKKYIYPLQQARTLLKSNKNTTSLIALTNVEFQDFLDFKRIGININSNNDVSEMYKSLEKNKFDYGIFFGTNDDLGKKVLNIFSIYFLNYKIIINDYYKLILFNNYLPVKPVSINYIDDYNLSGDSIGFEINEQNEFSFDFEFYPTNKQLYLIKLESVENINRSLSDMQFIAVYKTGNKNESRESFFLNKNKSTNYFLLRGDTSISSIHIFLWNLEKAKIKIKKPKIETYVSRETMKNLSTDINH